MSNSSKKSISGLGAVKRDFSSNMVKKELVPVVTASKRSSISDALRRAIEEGVASREADDKMRASQSSASSSATYNSSSKRSFASRGEAAPPAKRRQLPDSWDTSTPSSSYVSSYATSTQSYSSTAASPPSSLSSIATGKNQPLIVPTTAANASANPAEIFLSNEQRQILQLVNEGKNIFYTGSAGTGKSVLLREIIRSLHKKFVRSQDAVAVTASTGIAACNIGGVTLHSFAGIGLGLESAEHLADKIKKNKKASTRWLRTKVLIIDEVSMIDGELFDKLARIGSLLRRKSEPFGGIQIVVTGDFFQLPPVNKGSKPMKFAFEADLWKVAIKRMIKLTKVFRQKDQEFVDMLNEMRYGTLSQKSVAKFKTLSREIIYEDGLGPTELFPRRQDVDSSNNVRMGRLRGENRTYTATDNGTANPEYRQKLLENLMAPERLTIATDAQVMLIKNVDETLVNGSMGKVVRFAEPSTYATEVSAPDVLFNEKPSSSGGGSSKKTQRTEQKYPVVEFTIPGGGRREYLVLPETWKIELPSGEIQASRIQLPLILSWAMSIHKSQGQTLDRVKVDLAKVFEKGQAYVALSRATSMDGLQVLNFSADKVFVHEKVRAWSDTLETLIS